MIIGISYMLDVINLEQIGKGVVELQRYDWSDM